MYVSFLSLKYFLILVFNINFIKFYFQPYRIDTEFRCVAPDADKSESGTATY